MMTDSPYSSKIPVMKFLLVSMCMLALLGVPGGTAAAGGSNSSRMTATALTRHWSQPGITFISFSNDQKWSAGGGGCIYGPNSTFPYLTVAHGLELPDHARITHIDLLGVDASPGESNYSTLILNVMNNTTGAFMDFYSILTTGSAGMGKWGLDVDITVDYSTEYYLLTWTNNGIWGTSMTLCSVTVTYELPGTLVSLPLVSK